MLKPQRGKTLPVRIGRTADGKELLKLGVAKHSKHNADEITQSSPLAHKLPYPDQGPRRWTEALLRKPDAKSVSVKPGSYIATSLCDPFTTSTATTCNSSGFETLKEISP